MYKKDEVFINEEPEFDYYKVLELEPKFYTWKEDNVRELGFVVEDALNVHPAFVYNDSITNQPKNMKDRSILASLLSVVKTQQNDINMMLKIFGEQMGLQN